MERIDITPERVFSPQPMFIIGTKNEDGTPNFSVITWVGFSYDETPHIMMTIGGMKRTKTNILREGAFSANLITQKNLWLADYFGCMKGERGAKNAVPYTWKWGKQAGVPILDNCPWVYECEVSQVIELRGAHLFLGKILNIQIDASLADMDRERIDLRRLDPVLYAPYNYFSVGERLGECGEWETHLRAADPLDSFLREHTIVAVGKEERIVDDPAALLRLLEHSGSYVKTVCWWARQPIAAKNSPGGGGPADPRDKTYYFSEMYHWIDKPFGADTAPEEILAYIEEIRAAYPAYHPVPSFTIARKETP